MAAKLVRSPTFALAVAALCTWCALPPFSAAAQPTSPAMPGAAGASVSDPIATQPAAAAVALPPSSASASVSASSSAATAMASKKFPLPTPGGEPYLPAAEVASALPQPTPDELPSAASLGFSKGNLGFGGPGDECCGGGGLGWYGGPGGFGPGTYGYNGPLYFGSAPAGGFRSMAAANVVVPLAVACVAAAMYM
ncbi:hypothetical protein ACP70R_023966 [Stipagrostis hirtigluma subsp. patula]